MFERIFQWTSKHGAHLLFGVAALMALIGIWDALSSLPDCPQGRSLTYTGSLADCLGHTGPRNFGELLRALYNAALPFFGALVIQRADLWMQTGGSAVAMSEAGAATSWLARRGPRLLLVLAVPYAILALLSFLIWLLGIPKTPVQALVTYGAWSWLSPLWSGGLLLFGSLALDRFDRWLATVRPTYSD